MTDGGMLTVASRHATAVWLCTFDAQDRETARLPMVRAGDTWSVPRPPVGTRYGFRVDGPWAPVEGHRFDPSKLLADPRAAEFDRPFRWHEHLAERGTDTAALVPKGIVVPAPQRYAGPGWQPDPARDLVYELQVKAYTQQHPGVPAEVRGTVAGLAAPAVIDHLKRLGVGSVELMPLMAAVDERHLARMGLSNAWGYNPVTLFAPDPRLAPGGMAEVAQTVAALHAAGIGVVLDVVLNHSGESDEGGPTLSFRGLDNALYYSHDSHGKLINDAGCGNVLALHRAPVAALALDALRHWVEIGGIDGFRFDLATVMGRMPGGFSPDAPLLTAIAADPVLKDVLLIAEPWDIGPGGYQLGAFSAPWLEWNDHYRDDVRRFWRGDAGAAGGLATRLAGSADVFARSHRTPSASVNFVAAHDGFSLADVVAYADKHNDANGEQNRDGTSSNWSWNHGVEGPTSDPGILAARARDLRALLATLLVSRGTPMLTAGDEFGRTQGGNNNAYCQDNPTTWLNWEQADPALTAFTADLVQLRHRLGLGRDRHLTGERAAGEAFPDVTWLTAAGTVMQGTDWGTANVLGVVLADGPARICLWFNRQYSAQTVTLPATGPGMAWHLAANSAPGLVTAPTDPCPLGAGREAAATVTTEARSVVVLEERPVAWWPGAQDETHNRAGSAPAVAGLVGSGSGADDGSLLRLARAYGIEPEWWEVDGTRHVAGAETQRALLAALKVPHATAGDIRDGLRERHRVTALSMLPPTILIQEGTRARLPIRPSADGNHHAGVAHLTLDPSTAAGGVPHATPGIAFTAAEIAGGMLDLGTLPAGVHRLTVQARDTATATVIVHPATAHPVPTGLRAFGLTAHLYALRHGGDPGIADLGIGDFGTLARFARTSAALGGAFAGINPLHHLFPTDRERASPYQSSDRFRLDPIYLDLSQLAAEQPGGAGARLLAEAGRAAAVAGPSPYVNYSGVWQVKRKVLEAFWHEFLALPQSALPAQDFARFVTLSGDRLLKHAQFEVLAERTGCTARLHAAQDTTGKAGHPDPSEPAVRFRLWLQWQCDRQLGAAATAARQAGLPFGLYRDLAVGAAFDSGEVWAEPQLFATGVSLGAPPDPFARAGQVWNLAPHDPHALERAGFEPFRALLSANMRHAGLLRIDHVLGLMRQFWVPAGMEGREGAYVAQPFETLLALTALESRRAQCAVIGEDLGTVPDGLRQGTAAHGILSYLVLWFERQGQHFRSPLTYPALAAACLSSHDLPTFRGWQRGLDIQLDADLGRLTPNERPGAEAARTRETAALAETIHSAALTYASEDPLLGAHAALAAGPSALVLVQADDLTGETEPLNLPGTDTERPNWRRRLSVPVDAIPDRPEARSIAAVMAALGRARP